MAFPGAFERKEVRLRKGDQFLTLGMFVDGGATNNFPIEAFDFAYYINSEYPISGNNPCTLGFSLVDSKDLMEEICPIPDIPEVKREFSKMSLKQIFSNQAQKVGHVQGRFL